MAYNGSRSVKPSGVNAYSTLGGTTGYTVRSTRPYHSNFLSVWINIFCEIPSIIRCKSLSRLCSCLRANTTRIVHFPETTSNPWRVPSIALSWPATLSSRVCRCFVMLFLQNLLPGKYSTFSFVLHRREVLCYSSLCQTTTETEEMLCQRTGGFSYAYRENYLPPAYSHLGFLLP